VTNDDGVPVNGRRGGLPGGSTRAAGIVQGLVLALVIVFAATPLDEWFHDLVFRYVVSHEVRMVANGMTELGTTEVAVAILGGLGAVAYWTADSGLWRTSLGGLAGLAVGGVGAQLVKHAACRARPRLVAGWGIGDSGLPDEPDRRGFFHWPCFARWRYHSFPSGHANTAFTLAVALSAAAPARRGLWLLGAAGVGVSRIVLNAHFVGDVLAGALVGWWGGLAGLRVVDRWLPGLPRRRRPSDPDSVAEPPPTGSALTTRDAR